MNVVPSMLQDSQILLTTNAMLIFNWAKKEKKGQILRTLHFASRPVTWLKSSGDPRRTKSETSTVFFTLVIAAQ